MRVRQYSYVQWYVLDYPTWRRFYDDISPYFRKDHDAKDTASKDATPTLEEVYARLEGLL